MKNPNETNQIYNMELDKKEYKFYLQYKQLIVYYNFRKRFKEAMKQGYYNFEKSSYNEEKGKYIQNYFCLIDREWLENWKKHVGYKEIDNFCIRNKITYLDKNHYNLIVPIIERNAKDNLLSLLNNQNIYNEENDKVNPCSDFYIVSKDSYYYFTFGNNEKIFGAETVKTRVFPLKFIKGGVLLMFDYNTYQISFKNENNNYYEILLLFEEQNQGRKQNLDQLEKDGITKWIKNKIDLNSHKDIILSTYGCKFKLINKTLNYIQIKNEITNNVNPNINNQKQLLNVDNSFVSLDLKNELTCKMTTINRNPNNINIEMPRSTNNLANGQQFNNQFNNNTPLEQQITFFTPNSLPLFNNNPQFFNNPNISQNNINQMNNITPNGFQSNFNQFNQFAFQNRNNFIQSNMIMANIQNQNNIQLNNSPQNFMSNNINNYLNELKSLTQHKTGIKNIGQTCYMNATIQLLSNIMELSKKLLKKYIQRSFDIGNQTLSAAYSSLLYELFFPKQNEKYISPDIFKEIIGELNPLFKGMHAADAKDLIFFIIERMHRELNPIKQQKNQDIDFGQQENNSRDLNIMFSLFMKDFIEKNRTIISDIFYGITLSTMTCTYCNITKYSFQTFNLLIFQLKKVKEMTKKGRKNIDLYDAFEVDKREELLQGDNMIYCNECHCLRNGKHQQQIYSLPYVLLIVLNRGKDNKDFNDQIDISTFLDFTEKNIIMNKETDNQKFYLCGVITHLGESGSGGHFIAYCRNGPNSQFYCYNDTAVNPAKEEDAIKTITSKRDYEKRTPYILLFHSLK